MSSGGAVEGAMQSGPDAVEPPPTEVPPDCPPGREVARQQAPLATSAQQIEDRVDNGTQARPPRSTARPRWRKVRSNQRPLSIGQVGRIGMSHHDLPRHSRQEHGPRRHGGDFSHTLSAPMRSCGVSPVLREYFMWLTTTGRPWSAPSPPAYSSSLVSSSITYRGVRWPNRNSSGWSDV